jgi:hypothetical protein
MKLCRTGIAVRLAAAPLLLVLFSGTQAASGAQGASQHPLIDMLAQKIAQKYQNTPCAELKMKKAEKAAPTPQEQKNRSVPQERPAVAEEFHRQGRGSDCEPDVRLRDDPVRTQASVISVISGGQLKRNGRLTVPIPRLT